MLFRSTVANASSWYEIDENGNTTAHPLGFSGPFTLVIDSNMNSEEKILCSAVNVSTGVVTVWTDGTNNGRGDDGSPISAHPAGTAASLNVYLVDTATSQLQLREGVIRAITNAATAQSTANSKVASVTAADSTITVVGTSTAPTVKVGTVPYSQISGGPSNTIWISPLGSGDDAPNIASKINALASGGIAYLTAGIYNLQTPITITANGVSIVGAGYQAITLNADGTYLKLDTGFSASTAITIQGSGVTMNGIMVKATNLPSSGKAIFIGSTGQDTKLIDCHVYATPNDCTALWNEGASTWIRGGRYNGTQPTSGNGSRGIMVAGADMIISNIKAVSHYTVIEIGTNGSGAQIFDNHLTPGVQGKHGIWINAPASNIQVQNNRFDNWISSPIHLTPANYPHGIDISEIGRAHV